ncbi:MAG: hypothetical protein HUU15_16445 [Candidatus Brocadiae bacterium]|nr:hypothetical protein [Candidatus Brocadiia bacterium]
MHRIGTFGQVMLAVAVCAAAVPASAEEICRDATKIYFGEKDADAPATVRAAACFDAIPEWKEIDRRKLDRDDADYWILVRAANRKFKAAVESVARGLGHDLVAEEGSLELPEGAAKPPDLTQAVIDAIGKQDKE